MQSDPTLNDVAAAFTANGRHAAVGELADLLIATGVVKGDSDVERMLRTIASGKSVRNAVAKASAFSKIVFPPSTVAMILGEIERRARASESPDDIATNTVHQTLTAFHRPPKPTASVAPEVKAPPATSQQKLAMLASRPLRDRLRWSFRSSDDAELRRLSVDLQPLQLHADADLVATLKHYVLHRQQDEVHPDSTTAMGDLRGISLLERYTSRTGDRTLRDAPLAVEDFLEHELAQATTHDDWRYVAGIADRLMGLCEQMRFLTDVIEDHTPAFLRPRDETPIPTYYELVRSLHALPDAADDPLAKWRTAVALMALQGNGDNISGIAGERQLRTLRYTLSETMPRTELGLDRWDAWRRSIHRASRPAQDLAAAIEMERNNTTRMQAYETLVEIAHTLPKHPEKLLAAELVAGAGDSATALAALRGMGVLHGHDRPMRNASWSVITESLYGFPSARSDLEIAMNAWVNVHTFRALVDSAGLTRSPHAQELLEDSIVTLTVCRDVLAARGEEVSLAEQVREEAVQQQLLQARRSDPQHGTPLFMKYSERRRGLVTYLEFLLAVENDAQRNELIAGLLSLNDATVGLTEDNPTLMALRECLDSGATQDALERHRQALAVPFDELAFTRSIRARARDPRGLSAPFPVSAATRRLRLTCDALNRYARQTNFPSYVLVTKLAEFVDTAMGITPPARPSLHQEGIRRRPSSPQEHRGTDLQAVAESLAWRHSQPARHWERLGDIVAALAACDETVDQRLQDLVRTGGQLSLPFQPGDVPAIPIDEHVLIGIANAIGDTARPLTDRAAETQGLQWLIRQARVLNRIAKVGNEPIFRSDRLTEPPIEVGQLHPASFQPIPRELQALHLLSPRTKHVDLIIDVLRGWNPATPTALHPSSLRSFDQHRDPRVPTKASLIARQCEVDPDALRGQFLDAFTTEAAEAAAYRALLPAFFSELDSVHRFQEHRQQPVTLSGDSLPTWAKATKGAIRRLDSGTDLGLPERPLM